MKASRNILFRTYNRNLLQQVLSNLKSNMNNTINHVLFVRLLWFSNTIRSMYLHFLAEIQNSSALPIYFHQLNKENKEKKVKIEISSMGPRKINVQYLYCRSRLIARIFSNANSHTLNVIKAGYEEEIHI